jgi:hypothetical protein
VEVSRTIDSSWPRSILTAGTISTAATGIQMTSGCYGVE